MSIPTLLALTGDEVRCEAVATCLAEDHGFTRFSFAAHRREALMVLDPMLADDVSLAELVKRRGWAGAVSDRRFGPEVARLETTLAVHVCQALFGTEAWVTLVARGVEQHRETFGLDPIVVTDLARPEEAGWVRRAGGLVWAVLGPGEPPAEPRLAGVTPDLEVVDDASPDALRRRVARAVNFVYLPASRKASA